MAQHDDLDTRAAVKKQKITAAQKKENRLAATRQLLTLREGRDLLWHLFEITGLHSTPFAQDPNITAFKCGELNVGNQILALVVEANPDGYLMMMKEQAHDRSRNASSNSAGTSGSASPDGDGTAEDSGDSDYWRAT